MPTIKQSGKRTTQAAKTPAGDKPQLQPMAGDGQTRLTEDERRRMVAEAAYYRALQRGFASGGEVDDWLAAEREIDERLSTASRSAPPRESALVRAKRNMTADGAPARSVQ